MSLRYGARLFVWLMLVVPYEALDNGVARTPPMGWLSWTTFMCETDCERHPLRCVNEQLYMEMADLLRSEGYAAVGYEFVNIDDCWSEMSRDSDGSLVADRKRFPSEGAENVKPFSKTKPIKSTLGRLAFEGKVTLDPVRRWTPSADPCTTRKPLGLVKLHKRRVHQKGLKLGIYADFGNYTCEKYPGSIDHLQQDAKTFAEWDVDMLKVDGCYANASLMANGYPELGKYLNQTGKRIVYSCSWPFYEILYHIPVNYSAVAEHCNLWRNFDDIRLSWQSIQNIIDYYDTHQDEMQNVSGPGRWNDPDMIIVGNREITLDQSKVQMALWSIWSAPLLMSNDLRFITPAQKDILQNRQVIAINQDPLGIMGRMIEQEQFIRVYRKPVTPVRQETGEFSFAIVFFNWHVYNHAVVRVVQLREIGLTSPRGYFVEDLFENRSYGVMYPNSTIFFFVRPTGVVMIKATIQ